MGASILNYGRSLITVLKKPITYTDYNGTERTEDFYFNLTKAEIAEMNFTTEGGLEAFLNKISAEQDIKRVYLMFKDIVLQAYGEKTLDGKRFIKNQELRDAFAQTEAYSNLMIELLSNETYAAEFVNAIIPQIPPETK